MSLCASILRMMHETTRDTQNLGRVVAVPHVAEDSKTFLEMAIAVVVDVKEAVWEIAVWTRARTSQFQARNLCLPIDNSVAETDGEERKLCL
jgi:hypothetical protein